MTPENFAYWLKGFIEISETKTLNEKQTQIIKDHLDLVFNKVTPTYDTISETQENKENVKEDNIVIEKVSKRKKNSFQDILDNCEHTEIKVLPKLKPIFTPRRNNRGNDGNQLLC